MRKIKKRQRMIGAQIGVFACSLGAGTSLVHDWAIAAVCFAYAGGILFAYFVTKLYGR
jgi:hypothetical protein